MFKVGDSVVSASNGICKINDMVEMDASGNNTMKMYFVLEPVGEKKTKVYIPVELAEKRIRKVMGKSEAIYVIEHINSIEELEIVNERERETKYKEAIQSGNPQMLVKAIKNMYHRRMERMAQGKKSTAIDEKYFKLAEHNLHSELGYVLNHSEDEMKNIIIDYINGNEKKQVF